MRTAEKIITVLGIANAASGAPFPAPAGYRWDFVQNLSDGQRVNNLSTNQPIITLVRTS